MNITCSICKDQMIQSDDIFYTPCSHVFHFGCLTQWLERSQTCPQCREKATRNKINRLFFTFSNNETAATQSSSAQERIDNLKFKILLKEKDIQYYTSKTVTLEKQNAGLRQEIYKVESEISKQNSIIYELQEEIKYCDDMKKEIAQLKSRIEKLKPMQLLLYGPIGDVHEIIGKTRDPDELTKYISVMKKMLIERSQKKKELRMTLKRLQEQLTKVNTKCASLLEERMEFEEKLAISESKNMSLQQRVDELEEVLGINDKCSNISGIETKESICKRSSYESTRERNNQGTPSKSPTPTKRRKEKICSTKSSHQHSDKISGSQIENDSFGSKTDLMSSNSSSDSSPSKRARMSNNVRNSLSKGNASKSTKSIPKKKKESKVQTSVTENTKNVGIIDLT